MHAEPKEYFALRIPKRQMKLARKLAKQRRWYIADVVREALEAYLKESEKAA